MPTYTFLRWTAFYFCMFYFAANLISVCGNANGIYNARFSVLTCITRDFGIFGTMLCWLFSLINEHSVAPDS